LRTGAREQEARRLRRSIELHDKPTLLGLVQELEQLIDQYQALLRRYPVESATEENLPVRFPLSLRWRPRVGEGEPGGSAAEVIAWTHRLRIHLVNLQRHFVDWQERPEALAQFPLSDYPLSFRAYQGVTRGDLIAKLSEHKRLLLVEAEKQRVLLPQTLPRLLKEARERLGMHQAQAAEHVQVSLDTFKSWEQGRAFPRGIKHTQIRELLNLAPVQKPPSPRSAEAPV